MSDEAAKGEEPTLHLDAAIDCPMGLLSQFHPVASNTVSVMRVSNVLSDGDTHLPNRFLRIQHTSLNTAWSAAVQALCRAVQLVTLTV